MGVREASEKDFQATVIEMARRLGWACAHFRAVRVQRKNGSVYYETPAAADGKGWPDLVLCRPPALIIRELKFGEGRLSAEQREWLERLAASGADVGIWTPADWPAIERTLKGVG